MPLLALALLALVQSGREPIAPHPREPSAPAPPTRLPDVPFAGTLLDERGQPLAGWTVGAQDSAANLLIARRSERMSTTTDARGHFRFASSPGTSFALVLRPPEEGLVVVREDFRLDGHPLVLRLRPEDRPSSFVEGTLLTLEGALPPGASIGLWSPDLPVLARAEFTGERFRIGPLLAGTYELCAYAETLPDLEMCVDVGAQETLDLGTLRLSPPGWIEVSLTHPGIDFASDDLVLTVLLRDGNLASGAVRNGPAAETLRGGGCGLALPLPSPPRGRSMPLAPGRYRLRTLGSTVPGEDPWSAPDAWVAVRSGETSEVQLTLERARTTQRTLVLSLPEDDPAIRLRLSVTAADGSFRHERWNTYRGRNGFTYDVEGLLPGLYHLEARTPAGSELVSTFGVHDLRPSPEPLCLELR